MFLGAVMGVLTFSMLLSWQDTEIEAALKLSQKEKNLSEAVSQRYLAASFVFYPMLTLCVIYCMNTLLQRVSDHASHPYYNTLRDRKHVEDDDIKRFDCRDCIGEYALHHWVRTMHVIAVVICSLRIVAGIVAAWFRAELVMFLDRAAALTGPSGERTTRSDEIQKTKANDSGANSDKSFSVALGLEAAVYLLEISGFLLFFPAIIVMFGRIGRKMDALIKEMNLRSDHGTAFLPVEFSPQTADGSETQTEMPIVEVRQYLRTIQLSAAAQQKRFVICLLLFTTALAFLASQSVFVAVILLNTGTSSPFNPACEPCGACQIDVILMLIWYANASFLFRKTVTLCTCTFLRPSFSRWLHPSAGVCRCFFLSG